MRDCFKILLEENEKECIGALALNMDVILKEYCNDHAAQFYVPKLQSGSSNATPNGGVGDKKVLDFTAASVAIKSSKEEKKVGSKKIPVIVEPPKDEESGNAFFNSYVLPEYGTELLFMDLLEKLLVYDKNMQNQHGLWKLTARYLHNLSLYLHQFNMPEFHESYFQSLIDYIKCGNAEIRFSAAECLVKILQHQYSSVKR